MPDKGSPNNFFNESNKNKYEKVEEYNKKAAAKINEAANFLLGFLKASTLAPVQSETYLIKKQKYQAITFRFRNAAGNSCACEISVPTTFAGEPRMWTNNREGDRVWANIHALSEADFDGPALFKYLGGRIEEMSESDRANVGEFFGDDDILDVISTTSLPRCTNCGSTDVAAIGGSANLCHNCLMKNNTTGL